MSLEKEKILLESKINSLKRDREGKKLEGEMFVAQIHEHLSPYLEFHELDIEKARVAMNNIERLFADIKILDKDIASFERKLKG